MDIQLDDIKDDMLRLFSIYMRCSEQFFNCAISSNNKVQIKEQIFNIREN